MKYIWYGVFSALTLSLALGTFFTKSSYYLSFEGQEILGGVLSVITVGLITWMIFWLGTHAKHIKSKLHGSVDNALATTPASLALISFLAVSREGLETALFIWTAILATDKTFEPIVGATTGLFVAILLGFFIFKGALKINLRKFFFYTGLGLIVVAAGILAYGIHDFQEARVLPGLNNLAFNISSIIPADGWLGTLLKGIFNFSPTPSILESSAWALYLTITTKLFFNIYKKPTKTNPINQEAKA